MRFHTAGRTLTRALVGHAALEGDRAGASANSSRVDPSFQLRTATANHFLRTSFCGLISSQNKRLRRRQSNYRLVSDSAK